MSQPVYLNSGALTVCTALSSMLVMQTVSQDNVSVDASGLGSTSFSVAKSGYTPLGIIGYAIANASSSGVNYTWMSVYNLELNVSSQIAYVYLRNANTTAGKVKITIDVLYIKS